MPDYVLPDGRGLTFDLSKITMREYRALLSANQSADVGDRLIARCTGDAITGDELGNLPQPEYRRVVSAFFRKAREPLADPKSESVSTSG